MRTFGSSLAPAPATKLSSREAAKSLDSTAARALAEFPSSPAPQQVLLSSAPPQAALAAPSASSNPRNERTDLCTRRGTYFPGQWHLNSWRSGAFSNLLRFDEFDFFAYLSGLLKSFKRGRTPASIIHNARTVQKQASLRALAWRLQYRRRTGNSRFPG